MPNKNEERENEKMAKKLKKVFALLLTLSMVMSLLSVTALAKGHDGWPWGKPDDSKPTETEPAIPGSNDEVKVYLRYSNKVPDILKDHAAAEFGPSGNNKPYFTVKVNASSLEDAVNSNEVYCYTRVSDNRKLYTYYSAQEDEQADKPSLEELQNAWDAILGCMSKADQQKFADTFGRSYNDEMNFVGYVLKKEGNDWHIDGILNVKPGYITEFYLSSDGGRNYDLKDNSVEGSAMSGDTAYAKIEAMIQGVKGYDANSLRWNEEKTGGTFAVNGKVASFTVDEKSAKINDEVTYKNTSTDIYTAQIYVTVNITNEPADPFVNLSIEKRADKTSVQQGGELTYAIAVENNGNATATNVVITDTLPEGVEFKSASNEGKMVDGTVTWNIGELTAGAEKEVTVTVSVADDATVDEKITNTAFVTSDDEKEPKKDTVTTEVTTKQTPVDPVDPKPTPAAKLVVDKAAPATVKQGGELTYTITVENKGDAAAKNVVIKDTLPEGVEFKSANNEGKMVDGTITWTIGELAAGEKKTVTVVVSVPSNATVGAIISNTAVVTSDDEEEPKEDTVTTEVKPKDDGKKDDDDDDDDDRKKPSDPGTDIGEDPTPLDPGPDVPGTEIPESDVPLAEVPKTGDAAALWMILAGVSALGLAVVTFTTRKKENN